VSTAKRRDQKLSTTRLLSVPAAPDAPLGEHDGVTFRRERLAPILREILPLLRKNWEENGVDHIEAPFALDLDRYLQYDLVGVLQIVTARVASGMMVGYVFAAVHPHIDHSGLGWALLTWYWLYPEWRGGGVGGAMMDSVENFLREAGVSVVEATEKVTAQHGLFARRGYHATDTVFRKILKL
jgi:GNAT superfamily N-acetyltransferase